MPRSTRQLELVGCSSRVIMPGAMADEDFLTNITRMIAAELFAMLNLQIAREMFGKSYFSLGAGEKTVVDQHAFALLSANYQSVTPENLKKQTVPGQAGTLIPFSNPRSDYNCSAGAIVPLLRSWQAGRKECCAGVRARFPRRDVSARVHSGQSLPSMRLRGSVVTALSVN